jgi:chromate transport protein ChrA
MIYWQLLGVYLKIGIFGFGGGYAMLPILQREVVEHKGWATEEELMDYFAIGQCTPGVIAVNTATFIGQKHRGWLGGIVATLGVVFPSLVIISTLAGLITNFSHLAWVQNAFAGIQVCVCVLIFNAVLKLLKKSVVDKRTAAIFLIVMALLAAVVYAALHFFEAGYGYLFDRRYGPPVPNRVGWMVMESPVFILMCVLWASSERMWQAGPLALFCLFQAHYLQRAFIFPLLIRGKGRMPLGIVVMGMVFNTLNALMQGGWIFYVSPADYYAGWFAQPYIYIGGALFVAGMAVNLHSDHIIRHH